MTGPRNVAFAALVFATASIGAASPSVADIFRGCRGWIEISTARAGGMRLAELDASGRCANRGEANLCRDRARRRISSCTSAVVNDMDGASPPVECSSVLFSETRVNWFYWGGVDDVPYPDTPPSGFDRVARHACCRPNMTMEDVDVTFTSNASGDAGCFQRERLIGRNFQSVGPALEVNCAAAVARGICGPVGGPVEGPPRRNPTRTNPTQEPTRTNPPAEPTRTNPPRRPPPGNAGGDGLLRVGD